MTGEPIDEKGVQSPYGLETQVGDVKSTSGVTFTDKSLYDIIRYAVVGIYRVTAGGKFLFANAKLAEIFGYPSAEQFLSERSNILELYANPEDREPILQRMIAEGYVDDAEALFKKKDGQIIWVRIRARVILQGNGEEPIYEGFMADISDQKQAQDHLRQSESRYRSLYAKTPVMLHSIDPRGRFLNVSDRWLEVFGYERDEVIGRKLTDFMTEASRRYAESVVFPGFFKTGHVKDIPYQMVKRTGEVIDVLLSSSGERDENGEIFRTLAVLIDVTEKKKTEAELERYRKHLEEIVHIRTQELETVNRSLKKQIDDRLRIEKDLQESRLRLDSVQTIGRIGYWARDLKTDEIDWSDETYRIWGYEPGEVVPTLNFVNRHIHPDDLEELLEQRRTALKNKGSFFNEYRIIRRDGSIRTVRSIGHIALDDAGDPGRIWGILRDVTQYRWAEKALEKSEFHLREAQRLANVGSWDTDLETNKIVWSDQQCRILGYEPGEISPTFETIKKMIHPDDLERFLSRRNAALEGRKPFELEYRVFRKDGSIRTVHSIATVERDRQDRPKRFIGALQDITERRQAEMALRESEAQYRVTVESAPCGVLVHDAEDRILIFNSQLEAITGYTKAEIPDGSAWFEKVYPEAGYQEQMLADRKIALREGLGRVRTREATITRKDGEERICRFTSIRLTAGNRIVFIMDVTDQVRAEIELKDSHAELEERVRQRTAELETVNRELAQEIARRENLLEALQKSEASYRGIVETQTELICRSLPDGEITFVNTAICRAMGMSSQELVGQKFYQFVHPDDRETTRKRLDSLSADNPIVENEERVILPGGRERWWHWINQAMFDENGRMRENQSVGRDISAIKEAEAKVRESESHVRSLMESAVNFTVYRLRVDDESPLKVSKVFVSPSIEEIIGIPHTADHTQWYDTIHPDDRERVREANFRAFETQRFDETFRVYNAKKDEWRWIHVVSNGVFDEDGETKFINGIFIDVTDQKRAEEALRESEQRYRQLVETMGEGLVIQDENARITYVNERLCKMLGHTREELLEKKTASFLSPEARRLFSKRMASRRKGRRDTYEADLIRKNSERVPAIISARPLMDSDGRFMGSFAVVTDIRKIKETEQALRQREYELEIKSKSLEEVNIALRVLLDRRNEDKGQIEEKVLSNVKQLVTPYLEKLGETKLDSRQRSFVDVLTSNLNDIISPFTRSLSSKYMLLTPSEIQIANLLRQGQTTKDIAEMLSVSERTVETHRRNIRKKLGLNDRKANLRTHLFSID